MDENDLQISEFLMCWLIYFQFRAYLNRVLLIGILKVYQIFVETLKFIR